MISEQKVYSWFASLLALGAMNRPADWWTDRLLEKKHWLLQLWLINVNVMMHFCSWKDPFSMLAGHNLTLPNWQRDWQTYKTITWIGLQTQIKVENGIWRHSFETALDSCLWSAAVLTCLGGQPLSKRSQFYENKVSLTKAIPIFLFSFVSAFRICITL